MRRFSFVLWFAFTALSGQAFAACSEPRFTDPRDIRLSDQEVLIVTHASSEFDPRFTTKYGVDAAVRFAKAKNMPVVYLADESPIRTYFMEDCSPTHWVKSIDGDVTFQIDANHIYLAGGHAELCLSRSIHDILFQAAQRSPKHLEVTYLMDAIYSNGKTIQESDPFYKDFSSFMGIITYGRPGGERWPKLNLLEATGVIKTLENDYLYLQELLPRWDRTFPDDWRVELRLNEFSPIVLRPGAGPWGPRLSFHFIDSADLL